MSQMASSPAALARSLSYLQIDLTDPEFRKHLHTQARSTRTEMQALITDAIEAGELVRETNAKQLARTVEAVLSGSMMAWAHYQEGTAQAWMRQDLEAVLAPYLPGRPRKKRAKSR